MLRSYAIYSISISHSVNPLDLNLFKLSSDFLKRISQATLVKCYRPKVSFEIQSDVLWIEKKSTRSMYNWNLVSNPLCLKARSLVKCCRREVAFFFWQIAFDAWDQACSVAKIDAPLHSALDANTRGHMRQPMWGTGQRQWILLRTVGGGLTYGAADTE